MKFLVIEGLDGSGKSTQVKMMRDYLEKTRQPYKYLHFPRTESPYFGELVAMFLRGELGEINQIHPKLIALIYAGDRMDAGKQILEWLKAGFLVLVDRYTYSNVAYQCAKVDLRDEKENLAQWILNLEFNHFGIPKPDLSIFLDVPFNFIEKNLTESRTGQDRKYLEGNRDIHEEDLNFQRSVLESYLWQVSVNKELIRLDCSNGKNSILDQDSVFNELIALCRKRGIIE